MSDEEPIEEEVLEEIEEFEDVVEAAEAAVVLPLANDADSPIPALRDVKVQIVKLREGKAGEAEGDDDSAVLLQDADELAPKPVALSVWAYALASFFDGKRSAREAVAAFEEKFKQPIPVEQALDLQKELDQALFLYSKRFEEAVRNQIQSYLEQDVRPPTHAGSSYPEEPDILLRTINNFFTAPGGPDAVPSFSKKDAETRGNSIGALLAPHIDLRQGGATYAHAYNEMLKNCDADVFIILGVAHQCPPQGMFYVSQKDFGTPLGPVKNCKEISARLQAATGVDPSLSELTHRTEHSIEFQAVLLATLLGQQKRKFQIVPVLCGSLDPFLYDETSPFEAPSFKAFTGALRSELENSGRKCCVLCSVDLSHVGPEFNHSVMMTERLLPAVGRYDKNLLKIVSRLDPEAFFNEIARTQNSRHVDAVTSVLAMLVACKGRLKQGRILHYDQMLKETTHGAVSFAAMAFEQ